MVLQVDTPRLRLRRFEMADADEVFACITPVVTRFMTWDPPTYEAYVARCAFLAQADPPKEIQFVIRRIDAGECLGIAAVDRPDDALPELGIWMKEAAHGQGFGSEAIGAVAKWASATLKKDGFIYPVAVENIASRRIAEGLGGEIVATRSGAKYDSVVYRIPALR